MKTSFFVSIVIALLITQISLYASQSNILWHNSTTGAVALLEMNGTTVEKDISVVTSSNTNLVPRGIGDFTGDNKSDILFHNQNSGNLRIWKMDGAVKVDNILVLGSSNTNLKIAGVGNFDRDADQDIATFNTNSGALRIWVMDSTTRVDNVLVLSGANTNLVPRGVGDMDGDGIPDLVLRNSNSGAVRVWTMNDDFTRKDNVYVTGSSNTNLELRGVVDINGDGNNDILNYNTNTGKLRAWLMDGNLKIIENVELIQETNLAWSVRGAAMSIQSSGLTDIWRVYFTRTGGSEGLEKYLYLSLVDSALNSLSEYEGAAVANPVTVSGGNIAFTYQEGQRDLNLYGTVGSTEMSGSWSDNYSKETGTWRAVKGLITEDLKPVIYETGDIVMEWNHEDDSTLVTFYGTIPKNDEEPIFTGFTFDLNGTEEGILDITLDEQERMATSSLEGVDLQLTYNADGTFNYEIYSDGLLIYSGSDLSCETTSSTSETPLANSSSDITYIPTNTTSKLVDLNSVAGDLQSGQLLETSKSAEVDSAPLDCKKRVAFIQRKIVYMLFRHVVDFDNSSTDVKDNFFSYLIENKEFMTLTRVLANFTIIELYDLAKMYEVCKKSESPERCYAINSKVMELYRSYYRLQIEVIKDLMFRLYEQSTAPLCTDADGDGFKTVEQDSQQKSVALLSEPSPQGCGTKVDCRDNDPLLHPLASEICDDGIDNDCDGAVDCKDMECTDNASCQGPHWKLVKTVRSGDDYKFDDVLITLDGDACHIHDWYTIEGQTIRYEFSHKGGEGCKHIDISGEIGFSAPPPMVIPGAAVSLNFWGWINGYKSAMADGVAFAFRKGGGFNPHLNLMALTIENCDDVRKVTAGGFTFDGWQCGYGEDELKTYSFPEFGNDFFIELRGNRGVGIQWHYELKQ